MLILVFLLSTGFFAYSSTCFVILPVAGGLYLAFGFLYQLRFCIYLCFLVLARFTFSIQHIALLSSCLLIHHI